MPPRWLRWLIVVCWLATTSWLFWNDLSPSLRRGEPPPFDIDLVAEVQKGQTERTNWIVQRQLSDESTPQSIFRAKTWVDYHPEDDTCSLQASLTASKDSGFHEFLVANIFKIEKMSSEYRVTRAGQLRSLRAEVTATPRLDRLGGKLSPFLPWLKAPSAAGQKKSSSTHEPLELGVWGEVSDDQFFAHCRAGSGALSGPMQFDLPATELSRTSSVLMPLHPVNRIRGLRLGQSWRQPLVDPLRDAFAALPGFSGGVRTLQAQVLPQTRMLARGEMQIECLVIEFTDEEHETRGRTWVEQDSEQVQQQEALLEDGHWIMQRESSPRKRRPSS